MLGTKLVVLQSNIYSTLFLRVAGKYIYVDKINFTLTCKSKLFNEIIKMSAFVNKVNRMYDRYKFIFYKFTAFFGLGYKKKIYSKVGRQNNFFFFVGDRHWSVLYLPHDCYIFNIKKRNLVFFSLGKSSIMKILLVIKSFKKLSIHFKTKGFFLTRINRRWLMVRRLKLRGFIPKLSTKQKFL